MKKLVFDFLAISLFAFGNLWADHHEASPFKSLFDGKSLAGWDGDSRFWRVENGAIVGQTGEGNSPEKNTFLIYRKGSFGNFELRFQYQVEGYNSGMQYRSSDQGGYVMKGLQADFEARWHTDKNNPDRPPFDRFSGMFFEENGRMFMGQRGDVVIVRTNAENPKKPKIEKIATVGNGQELEKAINRDGWNEYIILANGNQYTHIINGQIMSVGIDEDELNFTPTGLIGIQLHKGPPMKIQVKDIRIRELD